MADQQPIGWKPDGTPIFEKRKIVGWKPDSTPIFEDATASAPPTPASVYADFGIGLAKSVGDAIVGAGQLVHKIPGVSAAVDALYGQPGLSAHAFTAERQRMAPTNDIQQAGSFVGDVAQGVFLPIGKGKLAARAAKYLLPEGAYGAKVAGTVARSVDRMIGNAPSGAVYGGVKAKEGETGQGALVGGATGAVAPELVRGGLKVASALGNKIVLHAISPNMAAEVGHLSESSTQPAHQVRQQMADTFINRNLNVSDAGTDALRAAIRTQHEGTGQLVKGMSDAGVTIPGTPLLKASAQRSIPWARQQGDPTAEVMAVRAKLRHLSGLDTPTGTGTGKRPVLMSEPNPGMQTPIEQWRMKTVPGDVQAHNIGYEPNPATIPVDGRTGSASAGPTIRRGGEYPPPIRAVDEGPAFSEVSFEPQVSRSSIPNPEINPTELNKALTGEYFRLQDAYGAGAGHAADTTVSKNWVHAASDALKQADPTGRVAASKAEEHQMLNLLGALSRRSYQAGQGVPIKLYEFLGGLRGELSPVLLGAGTRPMVEGWLGSTMARTARGQNVGGKALAAIKPADLFRAAMLARLAAQEPEQ